MNKKVFRKKLLIFKKITKMPRNWYIYLLKKNNDKWFIENLNNWTNNQIKNWKFEWTMKLLFKGDFTWPL